ncbi:hypothetical protein ALMP_50330 [Streptomyces sp. A012304]|nr:hypothetical protein ALMP_50330 [Streptomyces sp. A012304]
MTGTAQPNGDGLRHPVKKPKSGELTEPNKAFNAVIRGVHPVAERANALLEVTFKALRRSASTHRPSPALPEPPSSSCRWNMTAQPEDHEPS